MDEKSVFETRLSAGKRTYYFNVKEGPISRSRERIHARVR